MSYLVPESVWSDFTKWPGGGRWADEDPLRNQYSATYDDRLDGADRRLYETEDQLAAIRGTCRSVYELTPNAKTAVENLANYTLGPGATVTVVAEAEYEDDARAVRLSKRADRITQRFLDENDWHSSGDREALRRVVRDGEAFIALMLDPHDRVCIRFVEPELVREPSGDTLPIEEAIAARLGLQGPFSWTFGVITPEQDIARPLAYFVQWQQAVADFDLIPESLLVHIKSRDTDRNVKRGVSDFWVVRKDFVRESKLRNNMVGGAAVQSRIGYVTEYPEGTSKEQVQNSIMDGITGDMQQRTPGGGTRTVNTQSVDDAVIYHIPHGRKFISPPGGEAAQAWIAIGHNTLRACGVRWCMPEYMISGDASNAAYASTLVAESPFTKAREADQRVYAKATRAMIWKMLRIEYDRGAFADLCETWAEFCQLVEVTVEMPTVASTNRTEQASVSETEHRNGVLSIKTWRARSGLNHDDEEANLAEERAKAPPPKPEPSFPGFSSEQFVDATVKKLWEKYP